MIDDHPAIREALAHTINGRRDLTFVGEAESTSEAVELIGSVNPDVAVVDISLKEGHGLDLVEEIRSKFTDVQVIVFSMYDETAYAERAIRAGALGYVMKSAPIQDVVEAIREAAAGRIYLSRNMASRMLTRMVKGRLRPGLKFAVDELTDRELAVFHMLGEGLSVDEIADRLGLSRKTVEAYRRRAKEKLGLDTVSELLQHAVHWASGRKTN